MEIKAITGFSRKEISREVLYVGYTQKIECKNFWDSHGTRIEEAMTQHKFDRLKKIEIEKVVYEDRYSTLPDTYTSEWWILKVEDEPLDVGEIMSYRALKTKLKLDCCVGAG